MNPDTSNSASARCTSLPYLDPRPRLDDCSAQRSPTIKDYYATDYSAGEKIEHGSYQISSYYCNYAWVLMWILILTPFAFILIPYDVHVTIQPSHFNPTAKISLIAKTFSYMTLPLIRDILVPTDDYRHMRGSIADVKPRRSLSSANAIYSTRSVKTKHGNNQRGRDFNQELSKWKSYLNSQKEIDPKRVFAKSEDAVFPHHVPNTTYDSHIFNFLQLVNKLEMQQQNSTQVDIYNIISNVTSLNDPDKLLVNDLLYFGSTATSLPLYDAIDLVVVIKKEKDYKSLLSLWSDFLRYFHVIILVDSGVNLSMFDNISSNVPDFELYTRADLWAAIPVEERHVFPKRGSQSKRDSIDMISMGAWVSDKDFVFLVDVYSSAVMVPGSIETPMQWMQVHVDNLKSPSSLHYFTGLVDPYKNGFDFPRGHPLSLRMGAKAAVSQGLVSGSPDYDPIALIMKPKETHDLRPFKDAHPITIPYCTLHSISLSNMAFNSRLVGPAFMMFSPPSNHHADDAVDCGHAELNRYDNYRDIIAGWVMKVMLDRMGYGVKVGNPMVYRKPRGTRLDLINHLANEIVESNNSMLTVEDEIFQYLRSQAMAPPVTWLYTVKNTLTGDDFFEEILSGLNDALGEKSPYIARLVKVMKSWMRIWLARKGFLRFLFPVSRIRSHGPHPTGNQCALITISYNEKELLPIWHKYYSKFFAAEDIYILDHMSTDGSADPSKFPPGTRVQKWTHANFKMPVGYRSWMIETLQDRFLRFGYKCVLFSDVDELIVPSPASYPEGLNQYLKKFLANDKLLRVRSTAREIGHMTYGNGSEATHEPPLDWSKPILQQRRYFAYDARYNKPLLTKVPITYRPGFHRTFDFKLNDAIFLDKDLVMFHLRSLDKDFCMNREVQKFGMIKDMDPYEISIGMASHWNQLKEQNKTGELCKYTIAAYRGVENN